MDTTTTTTTQTVEKCIRCGHTLAVDVNGLCEECALATPSTPQERRIAAIHAIMDDTYSLATIRESFAGGKDQATLLYGDADHVAHWASRVEELRALGKTTRWQDSIDGWVLLINETLEYLDDVALATQHLTWAMNQSAVYAGYAA